MGPNYRYSESTVRPEALEISGSTVYLRRDISELKREDEQGNKTTYWTYQEATLTTEEFNQHANAILVSGQKNGDDNQLILMDAVADLYETIAMMAM